MTLCRSRELKAGRCGGCWGWHQSLPLGLLVRVAADGCKLRARAEHGRARCTSGQQHRCGFPQHHPPVSTTDSTPALAETSSQLPEPPLKWFWGQNSPPGWCEQSCDGACGLGREAWGGTAGTCSQHTNRLIFPPERLQKAQGLSHPPLKNVPHFAARQTARNGHIPIFIAFFPVFFF